MHVIELPKLSKTDAPLDNPLVKWLIYLSNAEGELMDRIAKSEPMIVKALTIEQAFAMMPYERRLYELREKGLRDINSITMQARDEGMEGGLVKGKVEAKYEIARAMKAERYPDEVIAKMTGFFYAKSWSHVNEAFQVHDLNTNFWISTNTNKTLIPPHTVIAMSASSARRSNPQGTRMALAWGIASS